MSASRVGFVLCSSLDQPIPSTRIAVVNMRPYLERAGMHTRILFAPDEPSETPSLKGVEALAIREACDLVVLQKIRGGEAVALAEQLANAGIGTVYLACDQVDLQMVGTCDATVVVTDHLKSLLPTTLQSRTYVVHDGIERPAECKTTWTSNAGQHNETLKAVLVTSSKLDHLPIIQRPPSWLNVRIIGRYGKRLDRLREIRWSLTKLHGGDRYDYIRFLANRQIECIPWELELVYRELAQADIGIIPIDTTLSGGKSNSPPSWQIKSENRLTLKMSMGLPVVATPIPSYESIIEHGVNGFFARSQQDWVTCFKLLRDPGQRKEIGLSARASVQDKFSMQTQAIKLINVFQTVISK